MGHSASTARDAKTHHLEAYLDFEDRKDVYAPLLTFIEEQERARVATSRGASLLEVGCAAGAFLSHLRDGPLKFDTIVGCEPDVEARARAPQGLVCDGSAFDLPFDDDHFDYVVMVSVLHHLVAPSLQVSRANWERAMEEAVRVCRPGGYVLIREGLAVRGTLLQQMIFQTTKLLARLRMDVRPLHIESGEMLAFLTPGDMERLVAARQHTRAVRLTTDFRYGGEFPGIIRVLWQRQTCSLTAILQMRQAAAH